MYQLFIHPHAGVKISLECIQVDQSHIIPERQFHIGCGKATSYVSLTNCYRLISGILYRKIRKSSLKPLFVAFSLTFVFFLHVYEIHNIHDTRFEELEPFNLWDKDIMFFQVQTQWHHYINICY